MKSTRFWIILLVLSTLSVWGATGYYLLNDPTAARKIELESRLQIQSTTDSKPVTRKIPPYEDYYQKIIGRPSLWEPLVAIPEAPPQEPNWQALLGDIRITQIIQGADGMRAKIRVGTGDTRGQWLSVGMAFNGATVKDISEKGITFVLKQNNREYTHTVMR